MNGPSLTQVTKTAALAALAMLALTAATAPAAAQNASGYNVQYGESLYRSQCGSCHGPLGGGLAGPALDDSAPMQMYGDFDSLVRYTEDTMPPSGPEQMTGSDAEAVTAHLVVNLGNPVSLPDDGGATEAPDGTETGTTTAGDDTDEPAGDGGTGAPGFAAPAALGAVAAALLIRRRR